MPEQIRILSPLKIANRAVASADDDVQPDLLYMESVLVSTGQNKNDDVFLPDEMWRARKSPVLKPVDWEHNTGREVAEDGQNSKSVVEDNQIIGVMYEAFATDKENRVIEGNTHPDDFNIVNRAVIYKYLFPSVASKIVEESQKNKLFVSMEAWFSDYDYLVGNKIVARNTETAFLDKSLRARGGDGFFGDQRVGRVLRNIVFGGVGLVRNPANEESVIKSFTNFEPAIASIDNKAISSNIIGTIGETNNSEVIKVMADNKTDSPAPAENSSVSSSDYKEVVQRLVKAEHTLEVKDSELKTAAEKVSELESKVSALSGSFASAVDALDTILSKDELAALAKVEAGEFFSTLASLVSSKLAKISELEAKAAEAKAQVEKLEAEKRSVARRGEIEKALSDFISDSEKLGAQVDRLVRKSEGLDDTAFAELMSETKELLAVSRFDKMKEEKDEEEEEKKEEKPAAKADEGVTDTSVLDNVKANENVPAGSESAVETVDLTEQMKSLAENIMSLYRKTK